MPSVTLLVNPVAGNGRATRVARLADARLRSRGARVDVVTGSTAEECGANAAAALAGGTDVLAVVGGDGLVHLAAQLLARTDTPLAVLPAGTGNDFARALGIPLGAPEAAADLVLDGAHRTVDLGRLDERWFCTVVTSGFDSLVAERVTHMRWPRGRARYNLAILAELARLRPRTYELTLDSERIHTEAILVTVGNGPSYGGGMRICPSAALDDGKLDVTVVGPVTRRRLVRVFPTIYRGTHVHYPECRTFRARRVRVAAPDVWAYADGERAAPLPLAAEAVPGALRVLVPGHPTP